MPASRLVNSSDSAKLVKVTVLKNEFGLFPREIIVRLIDVFAERPHIDKKTYDLPKIRKCWTQMAPQHYSLYKIARLKIF